MYYVAVTYGPHAGEVFTVSNWSTVSIGRDPCRAIPLPRDRRCDLYHLDLIRRGDVLTIHQRGTNPVMVEGVAIGSARLELYSQVRIGRSWFRVETVPAGIPPQYEFVRPLGEGASGRVVLVRHRATGGQAALKILKSGLDSASFGRFRRETRLLEALPVHANVARYLECGEHTGNPYYLQEYIAGETLDHLVQKRDGRLPWPAVVVVFIDVLRAIDHAHRACVVHRDIKPQHIIVSCSDEGCRSVVTDFGFSKVCSSLAGHPDAHTQVTEFGEVPGTIAYLSPDLLARRPASPQTDLFAIGASMFRALTGKYLYRFEAHRSNHEAVRRADFRPFPVGATAIPGGVRRIVRRATATDPMDRFDTADDMLSELLALHAADQVSTASAWRLLRTGAGRPR